MDFPIIVFFSLYTVCNMVRMMGTLCFVCLLNNKRKLHPCSIYIFSLLPLPIIFPAQEAGTGVVFLNVYGAPESIPRNEFRQPTWPGGPVR